MSLHVLRDAPGPELAGALASFETIFTYPLGAGRTFRISHGDDYPRFFRAMGEARSFVVEESGRVLGALGVAVRRLQFPDGKRQEVAYLGDLKVDPAARRGLVFFRLAWAAQAWLRDKASIGFGVVMDGTRDTPDKYTGHVGIPGVRVLGKTIIWQLRCAAANDQNDDRFAAGQEQVDECYRKLSRGRYASLGADPAERSQMPPVCLMHPRGSACGLVEDTRRAKRLHDDDGVELRSAHLSFFAFRSPADGVELMHAARRAAAQCGHPALFVALAPDDAQVLEPALEQTEKVVAPATVYGHGLDEGVWNINSSEI
jgi:hypothetical protein